MATRWGQSKPLGKCVVLSLVTHALLATYATTVEIVAASPRKALVRAKITDELPSEIEQPAAETGKTAGENAKPWERLAGVAPSAEHDEPLDRQQAETMPAAERMLSELPPVLPSELPVTALEENEPQRPDPKAIAAERPLSEQLEAAAAEAIEAPAAMRREAVNPVAEAETGPERAENQRPAAETPSRLSARRSSRCPAFRIGHAASHDRTAFRSATGRDVSPVGHSARAQHKPLGARGGCGRIDRGNAAARSHSERP